MERETIILTPEVLEQDGWTRAGFAPFDKSLQFWSKTIVTDSGRALYCTIHDFANRDDCNYTVHADNSAFQSVGSMDVRTLSELHGFLDLLSA